MEVYRVWPLDKECGMVNVQVLGAKPQVPDLELWMMVKKKEFAGIVRTTTSLDAFCLTDSRLATSGVCALYLEDPQPL